MVDISRLSACFTGHRGYKIGFGFEEDKRRYLTLRQAITDEVQSAIRDGYNYFYSGMAEGADHLCAEIVIELRKQYPQIAIEGVVPFAGQPNAWNEQTREHYYDLLNLCDKYTVLQRGYSSTCYSKRNRYMVDRSALLIAIYNGNSGGTYNTIEYAKKKELEIKIIEP